MAADERTRRVSHPILRLEVLRPDGTRQDSHRVFCQRRGESVEVGVCAGCVHCEEIRSTPLPTVECSVPERPGALAYDPDGERTEVGKLLHSGTAVLHETCSLRDALELLRECDRREVAVVDPGHVLLGIVREVALSPPSASSAPRAVVRASLPPRASEAPVTAAMTSPIIVHETIPIRTALRILASAHAREATVVTSERKPLGVFRDVDGLLWLAATRRAEEPNYAAETLEEATREAAALDRSTDRSNE
jgi:CBS domain-containing protein